jgi:hypothetical protein
MKKLPSEVVLARIIAQNDAHKSWLFRHRLLFGILLGGLVAVLGITVLLFASFMQYRPGSNATSRDGSTSHSHDVRADTSAFRGTQSLETNQLTRVPVDPPRLTESRNNETSPNDHIAKDDLHRVNAGPFSFVPPEKWERLEGFPGDLVAFRAPQESRWHQLGFGPNTGVRRHPNPRMSLESLKAERERILRGSVEKVNEYVKRTGVPEGKNFALAKKPEFSQLIKNVDGSPVLVSTSYSLIQDGARAFATKTHAYTLIRSEGLYMLTMTYPAVVEDEMDKVWQSMEGTFRLSP